MSFGSGHVITSPRVSLVFYGERCAAKWTEESGLLSTRCRPTNTHAPAITQALAGTRTTGMLYVHFFTTWHRATGAFGARTAMGFVAAERETTMGFETRGGDARRSTPSRRRWKISTEYTGDDGTVVGCVPTEAPARRRENELFLVRTRAFSPCPTRVQQHAVRRRRPGNPRLSARRLPKLLRRRSVQPHRRHGVSVRTAARRARAESIGARCSLCVSAFVPNSGTRSNAPHAGTSTSSCPRGSSQSLRPPHHT